MPTHGFRQTARSLGAAVALLLLIACLSSCATISPRLIADVYDAQSGGLLPHARVMVGGDSFSAGEDGHFERDLAPGRHEISVNANGFVGQRFTITVTENLVSQHRRIDLERRRLGGIVREKDSGSPLSGAQVSMGSATTTTDALGRFGLEALDLASLLITHPGYLSWETEEQALEATFEASGAQTKPLSLVMTPRVLEGTVRESVSGMGIHGVVVCLGNNCAESDGSGAYSLRYVDPGHTLTLSTMNYRPFGPLSYTGQLRLDAELLPWRVTISVRDDMRGEPLFGARVSAEGVSHKTDDRGQVSLEVLPGTEIDVHLEGYKRGSSVFEGQEALEVLLQPSRVWGTLLDRATGEPIAGAVVLAYPAPGERPLSLVSDEEGQFIVEEGLGLDRVVARAPGYRRVTQAITAMGGVELLAEPFVARGIYVPFGLLTLPERIERLLTLVETSDELNTVVIDVKGDRARLAWPSEVPLARELEAYQTDVMDLRQLVNECRNRGIYTIGRIVVFKDELLATQHPEWSVWREDGSQYVDLEELHWVDPFRQEVRDYNIALALEIAEMGFDEVQFDYLRFPSDGSTKGNVYLEESTFATRTAAMAEFCAQAYRALSVTPAFVSADVFGLTVWVDAARDMGIGQRIDDIAPSVDYLSPMLYPSTFGPDNLGFDRPVLYPYEIVYHSVLKAHQRTTIPIRPWLQHYSIGGVTYGVVELLKQKKGAEDADSHGWIYWNAAGKYNEQIFGRDAYAQLPEIPTPPVATPTPAP